MTAFELRIERFARSLFDGVALSEDAPRQRIDLAVLTLFEDERPLRGLAALIDWRTAGAVSRLLRGGFCTGQTNELVLLPGRQDLPSDRVVLVGLGPRASLDLVTARRLATDMVAMAMRLRPKDVLFGLPSGGEDRELSEALLSGVVIGLGGEVPSASPPGDVDSVDHVTDSAIAVPWTGNEPRSDEGSADAHEGSPPSGDVCRWWVIADERHAGRLRRLLEGPPRAAEP